MQVYLFLDLDDTLFQTLPKCPDGASLRPAAYRKDGAPLSFMTERQARLLEFFSSAATVIPTTARNLDAFRRVRLPFASLAVLDFGGVVLLPDGRPDPVWDAHVRPRTRDIAPKLETLLHLIREFIARHALGVNARVISDFDMPLYVVMKHPEGDVAALDRIRAECLPGLDLGPFFVHANENNLSVVPRFLGKERAVRHVLDHHLGDGPALTIGVGDSLSDVPYLRLCDFVMMPRASQLAACLASTSSPPLPSGERGGKKKIPVRRRSERPCLAAATIPRTWPFCSSRCGSPPRRSRRRSASSSPAGAITAR